MGAGPDARPSQSADTGYVSQIESQECTLRTAAQGQAEPCPRESCVFWEPGGAVVPGACVIERLGVDVRRVDLSTYLLEVRERIEQARTLAEVEATHREFVRRFGLEL
jgi:hypothetical protein